jgi:hypothetical protein
MKEQDVNPELENKSIRQDLEKTIMTLKELKRYKGYVLVDSNQGQRFVVTRDKKDGLAKAVGSYYPYVFANKKDAEQNLGFNANNGLGKIEWKVVKASEYYDLCIERIKTTIAILDNLSKK